MTPLEIFIQKNPAPRGISPKLWIGLCTKLRDVSFFLSGIEDVQFLTRLYNLILDSLAGTREKVTLPNGEESTVIKVQGKADFVAMAMAFMEEEGIIGTESEGEEYHNDVKQPGSVARLELVYDVAVRSSHGKARWESGMRPDVLARYPASRFVRFPGAKMKRLVHQVNEGAVRLKTDFAFWADEMNSKEIGGFKLPWAPYGFNSYMDNEDVSRRDAESIGLIAPGEKVSAGNIKQYGENEIERCGKGSSASAENIPTPLIDRAKEAFRKKLGYDCFDGKGRFVLEKEVSK